ncbi:triose-phosphate isomerase [Iamia majanohamensis]|uniref:Triosephosphate isomerase n=1 Tax=Iamia majanohamensis TaxID=467976 RepID=A0AAE9YAY0_9ACTN|nr:triose-phosphate isomerase [Iamia majanohamensis]WCO69091.1 triose-phosphate isomerase [Iamia majanohamensis]
MATRTPLMSGNWKMHHNHFEALATVQKLSYLLGGRDEDLGVEVSIHPPFTDLRTLQTAIEQDDMPIALGAQHCHWEEKGAFTGEVAPAMLAKLNVAYVICGHSERREIFGETDEWVNRKVLAILANGMTPIMCCGETLDEREAGGTDEKVAGQVRAGLAGVSPEQVGGLVVAYEPIWAIGTGRTATPEDAQATCAVVRATVAEVAGAEAAERVRIQYGGSVKPANAAELMAQPDIDGALVGGASLDADDFAQVVRFRDA